MTTLAIWMGSGSWNRRTASHTAGTTATTSSRSAARSVHHVRRSVCCAHTVTHAAQIISAVVTIDASASDVSGEPSTAHATVDTTPPSTAVPAIAFQYVGRSIALRLTGVPSSQKPVACEAETGP